MGHTKFLSEVWKKVQPLISDAKGLVGDDFEAIQFRGHNPESPNFVERGDISLWVNVNDTFPTISDEERTDKLLETHESVLLSIWEEVIEKFGFEIDRIMIAPKGSPIWAAAIHLEHLNINEKARSYFAPRSTTPIH